MSKAKEIVKEENHGAENTPRREAQFPVDIFAGKDIYYIEASLPGARKDTIDVNVDRENNLVIRAQTSAEKQAGSQPVYEEYHTFDYKRSFHIDERIDTARIEAAYINGVLKISLPLKEAVVRKIEVKTEA